MGERSFAVREDGLECVEVVAHGEFLERLARRPVTQITFQHFLECRLEVLERYAGEHLSSHGLVGAKAPADEHVITLAAPHFCAKQADVTHVMLRAGMRTPG